MRARMIAVAVEITLVLAGACAAQENRSAKTCMDRANTQAEMNECAGQQAKATDETLNKTYQQVLAEFKGDAAATEKVRAMERAWLAYRDAYMEAKFPAPDKQTSYGSIFPMEFDLLRTKLTERQVEALRDLLRSEGSNP